MAFIEKRSRNNNKDIMQNKTYTLYNSLHADTQRSESFKKKYTTQNKIKNIKNYFNIVSNQNNKDKFPLLTDGNISNNNEKMNTISTGKSIKIKKVIEDKSFLTKLKKINVNFHIKRKLKEEEKNESYDRIYNKIKLFRTRTHLIDNRLNLLYSENINHFHRDIINRKYVKFNEDALNRDNKEIDEAHHKVKFLKNTIDYVFPKYVLAISKYNNLKTMSFRNKKFLSPSQQNQHKFINENSELSSFLKIPLKIKKITV